MTSLSEIREIVNFKKNPVSTVLVLLGLFFILIGLAINFYNVMFKEEPAPKEEVQGGKMVTSNVPTNMLAVSDRINTDLGHFLLYRYDPNTDSGVDLLSDSRKRLDLVNSVLEKSGNILWSEGTIHFPYVSEKDYRDQYIKIYGSDQNYSLDMQAYSQKQVVDNVLGTGYVGWDSTWGDVNIDRVLEANFVDYDKTLDIYTISGTYMDKQGDTEVSSGTFIINYAKNDKDLYVINIKLNKIM